MRYEDVLVSQSHSGGTEKTDMAQRASVRKQVMNDDNDLDFGMYSYAHTNTNPNKHTL